MSDIFNFQREIERRTENTRDVSARGAMMNAVEEIDSGEIAPTAELVLHLTKTDDEFSVGWFAGNMKGSEMLAVLECAKAKILSDMGYT